MNNTGSAKPVSTLEREAVGGAVSEIGLSFQQAVLLEHLPRWLREEGFTRFIRESLTDIEGEFYVPGVGWRKEFIEAKDHAVTPGEFKIELRRFQEMEAASPGTFRWFTLACRGLSATLQPLGNGLRNLRDPFPFYAAEPAIQRSSYQDFESIVLDLDPDYTKDDAEFLFRKVAIRSDYGRTLSGLAHFQQGVGEHLPEYVELPLKHLTAVFDAVYRLISGRLRKPVSRRELEATMRSAIPEELRPKVPPVIVWTHTAPDAKESGFEFFWSQFFGGSERQYPQADVWKSGIVEPLISLRGWVEQNRSTRTVQLEGSRRLSTTLAIGASLPAVSGFVIRMNYRGEYWETDTFNPDEPTIPLIVEQPAEIGTDLVVVFSVLRPIRNSVEEALSPLRLQTAPLLSLHSNSPIASSAAANELVRNAKQEIHKALALTKAKKIHLFYAGPAPVALFLGHRLNATASIQCYEWLDTESYKPTCFLV